MPNKPYYQVDAVTYHIMSIYRELLKSSGFLVPAKVTVWGQIVTCDWLKKMSRVISNTNVGGYDIAQFVNNYQASDILYCEHKTYNLYTSVYIIRS
jgi:hypothetical protein